MKIIFLNTFKVVLSLVLAAILIAVGSNLLSIKIPHNIWENSSKLMPFRIAAVVMAIGIYFLIRSFSKNKNNQ